MRFHRVIVRAEFAKTKALLEQKVDFQNTEIIDLKARFKREKD